MIERLRSARCRPAALDGLSGREREILALMAAGRTNSAICQTLSLNPKTVETHVRAIFTELDLRAASADHRRVLAVRRYLQSTEADQQRERRLGRSGVDITSRFIGWAASGLTARAGHVQRRGG